MWTKITLIGCLFLTVFVLHTALRIEHLNGQMGTFLPRADGWENEEWGVPESEDAMDFVRAQIAKQRANLYAVEHPGEEMPPIESFVGEPYNDRETGFINRHKRDHATFQELHGWVFGLGALQIGLAPLAFAWSVCNLLVLNKVRIRMLSTACACLAFSAIFLMILRGY